ncbi:glutathione S-transferase family protein [Caldimonas brevitalea]|uniref:Glutathione S-transferase n=1 Tax=Caldimonas brevitalea TaxID=413882 RepID=A0A0G3BBG0_9BURK|nr:glutathione S-transferase family protein [Caldimonas brevitalea]AKJ26699.1 glutathione S-transferase [Caldimonas brevitalea]
MDPVLFYGVPQGCSFGSIVALEWLQQPYRLCRIEMLEHPWPPLYRHINPMLQTPALLLPDGEALSQSMGILLHLAAQGLDRGLGFAQGTREFDRLNQMLAFLHTDVFSAFGPLWAAYDLQDLTPEQLRLLQDIGQGKVRKCFEVLNGRIGAGPWLLGAQRTVADAYACGVVRWADFHRFFDLAVEYPHIAQWAQRLADDPAVQFAHEVERQGPAAAHSAACLGHVQLDELPVFPRG